MNTTSDSPIKQTMDYAVKQFRTNIQTYAIILALVGIWVFFSAMTGGKYFSPQNFSNLFRQMTVTSFLACGMVLVVVTGNIDLSVGKMAGFVSVVVAFFLAEIWKNPLPGNPLLESSFFGPIFANPFVIALLGNSFIAAVLAVLVGLAVGTSIGTIEGYIVSYLKVPSFIVSLGVMWILNGAILLVTQGKTIPSNQPFFSDIAQGYLPTWLGWAGAIAIVGLLFYSMLKGRQKKLRYGFELVPLEIDIIKVSIYSVVVLAYVFMVNFYKGVQVPVLLLGIAAALMSYVSSNTPFGRYAYAIGGNREAARLSGVNIRKNVLWVFVVMGFLCGISGIVLSSYVGFGTIAAGDGYELDAIASCILGGTSTLGGVGTVFGAMVGALIMASLTNGLQILNVQPAWQYLLKGAVLIFAVYMDVYFKKTR